MTLTFPRSMSLLHSLRKVNSLSETALGSRILNSKNLELSDFISTVYFTFSFSCVSTPYPVIDFIIRKGNETSGNFPIDRKIDNKYLSSKHVHGVRSRSVC